MNYMPLHMCYCQCLLVHIYIHVSIRPVYFISFNASMELINSTELN